MIIEKKINKNMSIDNIRFLNDNLIEIKQEAETMRRELYTEAVDKILNQIYI